MAASTPVIAIAPRKVISGHGRFNENRLAKVGRKPLGSFPVPEGMVLTFYAPPGAALDDSLANRIELGEAINATDVELKMIDGAKVASVPTPYPYVYRAGALAIDFTVTPPDRLKVAEGSYTVTEPAALRTIVFSLKEHGFTDIHYACCGTGFSDSRDLKDLFPWRGWYVRLKR
ncbi:MAG TPA: hypothetical protein VNW97_05520 [Candidatus Saccharimonadales bacterium]|jgi:hypothetical protein|nr:hypothetical protein [Candidatus Saccharimonadales bacterium]